MNRYPPSMSLPLLLIAREQAERSEPAVRAAGLMHIARVLVRSDQVAAEELLERGLALTKEIDVPGVKCLLANAIYLAAAVSPKHALPLYAEHRRTDRFGGAGGLVNAMAEHGHVRDAIAYLNDPLPGDRFPLHFLGNLAAKCHDDETRLKLMEVAIRAWRNLSAAPPDPRGDMAGHAFSGFFARYWHLLSPDMATPVLRELVPQVLSANRPTRRFAVMGQHGAPELTLQENELFQLFPALRTLAPDLGRSVLKGRPQLAAAVEQFPLGWDSAYKGRPKFDLARDDAMMIGDSAIVPMTEVLANDFKDAFQAAHDKLAEDTDPDSLNVVPKECWPSAREFRNILFKAGQHLGLVAAKYLERIPDTDLRLFAQIELCAAVTGLPQLGGVTAWQSTAKRKREFADLEYMFGPVLPGIRCPGCKWTPRLKNVWACKCGHQWNTFQTRGPCPKCHYQWEITACLQCGVSSPHQDWYEN